MQNHIAAAAVNYLQLILFDFDVAALNVAKRVIPAVCVSGCFFHLTSISFFIFFSFLIVDNINFTYKSRCYNSIFTNFEKLLDVNLFTDMYFLIFVVQINPACSTYILQSLQGHSRGTHFLNFALKLLSILESFIFFRKISQIFGAKNEIDLVAYLTDFILRLFRKLILPKL